MVPRVNVAADWNVSIGPAWRQDNDLRVHYDAAAVSRGLRGSFLSRREPGAGAGAVGPADAYADRDYRDGFVYTDAGTADPETDVPGLTWYWGYDSTAQNDGSSVSFHADGSSSYSERLDVLPVAPQSAGEDRDLTGLQAGVERTLWGATRPLSIGVVFNATWYRDEDFDFQVRRGTARRTVTRGSGEIVDRYQTFGYTAPGAPYAGSYDGPGPLIHNIPESRTESMSYSSRSVSWNAASRVELEMSQSELALGPWIACKPLERVQVRLSPQLMLAHVCLDAEAHTAYSPANPPSPLGDFSSRAETSDWILGAGLEAAVRIDVGKGWSLGGSLAAAWWADDVAVRAEPFDARLDLGTWRASATIGKEF